jgi:hypothetical protein
MKHKGWWLANTILTVLFASGIYVVLVRRVDGTGHLETLQSRLLALAVLAALAFVIIIVQLIIWWLLKITARR